LKSRLIGISVSQPEPMLGLGGDFCYAEKDEVVVFGVKDEKGSAAAV
jgi:hypothetical protein